VLPFSNDACLAGSGWEFTKIPGRAGINSYCKNHFALFYNGFNLFSFYKQIKFSMEIHSEEHITFSRNVNKTT